MLIDFNKLDERFQNPQVREYYDILKKKKGAMFCKRVFDIAVSLVLIILLSPMFIVISMWIAADSRGGIIFRQKRVTKYGREFCILKFRTMVKDAPALGPSVTPSKDPRITSVGRAIRKYRLDELPQLFNVLVGDMSFVGTRPEVPKYVKAYAPQMYATLLLPAGITSIASIKFKDEDKLLSDSDDPDTTYIEQVLPQKMIYNLEYLRNFSFFKDIGICFKTLKGVF